MYAIVEIAGQQFKVQKDQKIFVHRLDAQEGKKVDFDKVLLIEDKGKVTLGAPAIKGAAVSAKVEEHVKGDKVIVFRKKRRKGYRKKNGHRQSFTSLTITDIVASGAKVAKPAAEKKETPKTEAAPKKEAPKKEAAPKAAPKAEAGNDLSKMTVAELKDMAKAKGIEGISSMKKADLIAALS
ncbi:50S ribosomal protein L21 [Crocinitomicaceae bacterium]|nr:50S ribosomal protein L21 [Crocinitomicaceae bacterium]